MDMMDNDSLVLMEAYKKVVGNKLLGQLNAPKSLLKHTQLLDDSEDINLVFEAIEDIGAKTTQMSDEEMSDYLQKTKEGKKTKEMKYKLPYIHRGNIDVVNDSGKVTDTIDIDGFKKLISVRPEKLIKQNTKMQKSGGESQSFYNTSLPALKGLALDEKTNKFIVVDTCPSSGICKTYCYAKKGGYVQWKSSSLSQTRVLNFLMNDWEGYRNKITEELNDIAAKNKKKGVKTVLRWNDSGDMLSDKYFEIVMSVARSTPDVQHYAYTKEVKKAKSYGDLPKNFIFNYSFGGLQDKKLVQDTDKISVVVPDALIKDYITKQSDADGKWVYKNETALLNAKKKISLKYNIDLTNILSIDELSKTPKGEKDQYNVIVLPGESDLSASRDDVRGTYLILH
jgi:hypothetical protein